MQCLLQLGRFHCRYLYAKRRFSHAIYANRYGEYVDRPLVAAKSIFSRAFLPVTTHPSFYEQSLRNHTRVSIVKRLKVRDVIAREVATIDPSVSLLDAAKRMVEAGTDAFIVAPLEKDEPFGIITQRDVVDLFADEVDIGKVTVGEVANKPLFIVSPGMPILYAAKMFRKGGVNHLAVFNGQEILGIISCSDVLNGLPSLMEQIYSEFD